MPGLSGKPAVCCMKAAALLGKLWSRYVWRKHLPGGSQCCWRTVERLTKALTAMTAAPAVCSWTHTENVFCWPGDWLLLLLALKEGLNMLMLWNVQIWDSIQTAEIVRTCQISTDCHCLRPTICGVYRSGFQYENLQKALLWKLERNSNLDWKLQCLLEVTMR